MLDHEKENPKNHHLTSMVKAVVTSLVKPMVTTLVKPLFLNFLRVQILKQFWAASPVATVQVKVGKCQVKHTICDF